ncbi:MAG: four helix bundle protein [Ignavibacteriales bacterium]|nr:MAG: four helix bundle protein [Ignavibacteriales bacterium]
MPRIENRVCKFSVLVVKSVNKIDSKRVNISLMDQIIKSAASIGANLVEAKSAHQKKFLYSIIKIALK